MKRLIMIFLAVLFLAGCQVQPDIAETEVTTPPTETAAVETTQQTGPETQPTEATAPTEPLPEPENDRLVRVADYIPEILQELRYATTDNFTGQRIYDFSDAYLRYGTVKKLQMVCGELEEQGLYLKIWDGFRPISAQFKLWEVCPDPTYVANPTTGYSSHSRGNTIDLTLVDQNGAELEMPTGFDDFSAKANRDYSDCSDTAAANAEFLESVMEKYGFSGYYGEWWHYSDEDVYAVEESFEPAADTLYYADCEEFISLRTAPDTSAKVITRIPAGEEFTVMALDGEFAFAEYQGMRGYVLRSYIQPLDSAVPALWAANCEEFISLRQTAGGTEVLAKIPDGETFQLESWNGKYARVSYEGMEGYVLTSYMEPESGTYFQECLNVVTPTDCYTHNQMLYDMNALENAYPDTVTIASIGTSELGRDIPVLLLGDPEAEYHVLLQGAIHGREHMTAWLLMALADYWLDHDLLSYGDVCWHIIPMTNPDGVAISQDGALDETQTAIYKADKAAGFTTLQAAEYAALWKANGLGIDINRNFPAGWESIDDRSVPSSQKYKGEAPFSTAEARALRDYTLAYDFDSTISYHAYGSVIYWEFGNKQPVNDQSESLGEAVSLVTGYTMEGSDSVDGAGYKDWVMEDLGIPSLTIEIGCQEAPLQERELYSIFARNSGVLPAIAKWLQA